MYYSGIPSQGLTACQEKCCFISFPIRRALIFAKKISGAGDERTPGSSS